MIHKTKTSLCGSSPSLIMKSPKVISELGLQSIKPILYLMKFLNAMPLFEQHDFHLVHAICTLSTCVTNETTSSTELMNPFITTLKPNSCSIIKSEHKTSYRWHPRIYSDLHSHKSYIPWDPVFPINPFHNSH